MNRPSAPLGDLPSRTVAARCGFAADQVWLDETRPSAVRLAGGCSGRFVWPNGLATTDQRCVADCVQDLTTAGRPVFSKGFTARTMADEVQRQNWIAARDEQDLATPSNLVATTDIIGGNSGSPMIDRKREVVGLVFDGNIHSLGGEYWFDSSRNRTIAVHSAAMLEALGKVYGGQRIVEELTAAR